MRRYLLPVLLAVSIIGAPVWGQTGMPTKAETALYTKTMKKPSVKAYEKFLAKYPASVYAEEVLTLRDATLWAAVDKDDAAAVKGWAQAHPDSPLIGEVRAVIERHNTSPVSRDEAFAVARGLAPAVQDAAGWRHDNLDRILGLRIDNGKIMLTVIEPATAGQQAAARPEKGNGQATLEKGNVQATLNEGVAGESCVVDDWQVVGEREIDAEVMGAGMEPSWLAGPLDVATIGDRKYLSFSYLNAKAEGKEQEYVATLYDPDEGSGTSVMFYGKNMLAKPEEGKYRIEGRSPETLASGGMTAEQVTLLMKIDNDENLVQIKHEDELTDEAIKWWLQKNPNAQGKASSVTFGALDPESSIVAAYKKAKKESSSNFNAALFNFRDYTVVVTYSKSKKSYILAWCEPVCRNKSRDQLLNTIYFENDNSLALYFYKGKTTYKWHLNLATRSLRK